MGLGKVQIGGTWGFWRAKRVVDVCVSLALLPVLAAVTLLLMVLNPWLNPGPLLFWQKRVGRFGRPFLMVKFRTMRPARDVARFADTEVHRIGAFGRILRRYRIDELPQLLNVIRGDMSLIGPRPEQPEFAREYGRTLPGYGMRHVIRPGVSGLSQVLQGYTCDTRGTERKLALDLRYIRKSGYRMEAFILWRTLVTLATGFGAR